MIFVAEFRELVPAYLVPLALAPEERRPGSKSKKWLVIKLHN